MKPLHITAYLHLAVTWGLSFIILLHVVEHFGWAGSVAWRGLLAGVILAGAARIAGRKLDFKGQWRHIAVIGATTVAGQYVFLSIAATRIGTAMSAIIIASIPLFSMIISQAMGLERISGRGLTGIGLGLTGMLMLVGFPAESATPAFVAGCLAALAGSFFAAYGSNHASRYLAGVGSWEVTTGASFAGGIMTLPLLAFVPAPGPFDVEALLWLLAQAGVISALNYVIYFRLVKEIGATRAISVEFIVTIVAVAAGTALLGERLTALQLAGAAVIIAGCLLVLGLFRLRKPDIHA